MCAGMTGSSHLWADEVEQEDAAKGIPPPEKFTPAPEWRGSGTAPNQPRAFSNQPQGGASQPSLVRPLWHTFLLQRSPRHALEWSHDLKRAWLSSRHAGHVIRRT